ncbi:MAG: IclR family transcriptional regulator [Blautia sp.]
MQEIAEKAGELVYLSIPKGDAMVYVEGRYPSNQRMLSQSVAGEREKMYCTSVGKAILATMSQEEIDKILVEPLEAVTEYTITDREKLMEEIERTRQRGYGIDNMELMFGMKCVGVALLNHKGQAEAGLSVNAPSLRMDDDKIREIAGILKEYAEKIQKML